MSAPTLEFRDLTVAYRVRSVEREVLRGVSLTIAPGEAYGLVGESGCGKSTAAFAAMRYLPRNGAVTGGSISFEGRDISSEDGKQIRELRRTAMAMVYQNPIAALNPTIRIGAQVAESFRLLGHGSSESRRLAEDALRQVQIADPAVVMGRYPHQLSGGMAQRVVIAMALACKPRLLVLDEPTTGLDATVEAEVLDLVRSLRERTGTSLLFISHNLGIIRSMCDRVGVLYAGKLVEEGRTAEIMDSPHHPYSVGLMRCIPRGGMNKLASHLDTIPGSPPPLGTHLPGCVFVDRCAIARDVCHTTPPEPVVVSGGHTSRCHFASEAVRLPRTIPADPIATADRSADDSLLEVEHLSKTFRVDDIDVPVLRDVNLSLRAGETLGLVGESGSGKTTLAKVLLGIYEPDQGSVVRLDGTALAASIAKRSASEVGSVQIVFQNPDSALNRRHSVTRIVARAVRKLAGRSRSESEETAQALLGSMSVDPVLHSARPAQLSGGLKQRVAIARSFAGRPRLIVCDEPTSALDVSVQANILNLLSDLQAEQGVSYVFISHDLGVVRYLSDRIAVMYLGRIMELGPAAKVFDGPHHPYTEALVSSVPAVDGEARVRVRLGGEVPSPADPPSGCVLHPRCPRREGSGVEHLCSSVEPTLTEVEPGHLMACHIPVERLRIIQRPN